MDFRFQSHLSFLGAFYTVFFAKGICAMVKSRVLLGMVIPPLIGILIMGPYKPLRDWVDEFIPYDMEIMGV